MQGGIACSEPSQVFMCPRHQIRDVVLSPDATWQVVAIRDIIAPPNPKDFTDVYIVYELMDTDLHQIIRSDQPLTEDHCQVGGRGRLIGGLIGLWSLGCTRTGTQISLSK